MFESFMAETDTVTLLASCCLNIGPGRWIPPAYEPSGCYSPNNDWAHVQDECSYEAEIEVAVAELYDEDAGGNPFLDVDSYSMWCPECGGEMCGGGGHFELVDDD